MFTKILVAALCVIVIYLYLEVQKLKDDDFIEDTGRDDLPAASLTAADPKDAAAFAVEKHVQEYHRR